MPDEIVRKAATEWFPLSQGLVQFDLGSGALGCLDRYREVGGDSEHYMINSDLFAERVQMAFRPTPRGVIGLVDDLLDLCRMYQLRINFRDGHCNVRRLGADTQESLDIAVPKAVFRAALARIATICNDQRPQSVTPYRGDGDIVVPTPTSQDSVPPSTCHVSFTNTPSDQRLELCFSRSSAGDGNCFTVLLRDKRIVTVCGHTLKYIPNSSNSNDYGSYGVLSRTASGGEVLVALFPVSEVAGVFSGDLRESSESAPSAAVLSGA